MAWVLPRAVPESSRVDFVWMGVTPFSSSSILWDTLWFCYSLLLKMAIYSGFSHQKMVIFHSFLYVYQRVRTFSGYQLVSTQMITAILRSPKIDRN